MCRSPPLDCAVLSLSSFISASSTPPICRATGFVDRHGRCRFEGNENVMFRGKWKTHDLLCDWRVRMKKTGNRGFA